MHKLDQVEEAKTHLCDFLDIANGLEAEFELAEGHHIARASGCRGGGLKKERITMSLSASSRLELMRLDLDIHRLFMLLSAILFKFEISRTYRGCRRSSHGLGSTKLPIDTQNAEAARLVTANASNSVNTARNLLPLDIHTDELA